MTILCRTCHTHVETPCKGYYHNCKTFKQRMEDEKQARIDEQNRLYQIEVESHKKRLKESSPIYISEIPDNLKDKHVKVADILRFVKGENLKMYEQLIHFLSGFSETEIQYFNDNI